MPDKPILKCGDFGGQGPCPIWERRRRTGKHGLCWFLDLPEGEVASLPRHADWPCGVDPDDWQRIGKALDAYRAARGQAPERIPCSRCGKPVSTSVPPQTIVRAWIDCPECVEKHALQRPEAVERVLEILRENPGYKDAESEGWLGLQAACGVIEARWPAAAPDKAKEQTEGEGNVGR